MRIRLPKTLLLAAATLVEYLGYITSTYPTLNREKVAEFRAQNWHCDITSLQKDIAFKPQYSLEAGMEETLEWAEENNLL